LKGTSRRRRLRDVLPSDLFRRTLLMVALPILFLFGIATWFFFDRHWDTVQRRLAFGVANDLAFFVNRYVADDFPTAVALDWERATLVRCGPAAERPRLQRSSPWVVTSIWAFEHAMDNRLPDVPRQAVGQFGDDLHLTLATGRGRIDCRFPLDRITTSTPYIFLIWILSTALLVLSLSVYFLWKQIVPIRHLSGAMDAFGRGEDRGPIVERGADEIRRAARAFEQMKARIQRQVQRRTAMLAAVSHDLRTPLSRMRIEVEMLDDSPDKDGLRQDIAEMEAMIQNYLDFARDQATEPVRNLDLGELAAGVAATFRHDGVAVTLPAAPLWVWGRADALRRALGNLIANALRYGTCCRVSVRAEERTAVVVIDDDGPGIPADRRADVFRPFVRLDDARNALTGGAGLGLAIARDVVLSHGGSLKIDAAPAAGARLVLTLPR